MRIAVLGVGLIGGSVGQAARSRLGATVSGFDPDPAACAAALGVGAIDTACASVAEAVADADVIVAAAPARALAELIAAALAAAPPDAVVTDVGSVKTQLGSLRADPRFIGGHPMAGAESGGVQHARPDLFDGAPWYLTPAPDTPPGSFDRLAGMVRALGAHPLRVEPEVHDRIVAAVSHVPHVFANVLALAAQATQERTAVDFRGGPSFRDATRVAGANSDVWVDIYQANAEEIAAALDDAVARLEAAAALLRAGDVGAIRAWNDAAAGARDRTREEGRAWTDAAPGARDRTREEGRAWTDAAAGAHDRTREEGP